MAVATVVVVAAAAVKVVVMMVVHLSVQKTLLPFMHHRPLLRPLRNHRLF